jgi:hypothetical protein
MSHQAAPIVYRMTRSFMASGAPLSYFIGRAGVGAEFRRPDVASILGSCCPVRTGGACVQVAFFRQVTRAAITPGIAQPHPDGALLATLEGSET